MAEIVLPIILSPIIKGTILKTASLLKNRIVIALHLEKKLNRLCFLLQWIQSVVQLVEERQESDPAIKCWLQDLKDVAYEVADVLDECEYQDLEDKLKSHELDECEYQVLEEKFRSHERQRIPESISFSPKFRHHMVGKIKHITKRLSYFKDLAGTINLVVSLRGQTCPMQYPKTDSFPDNSTVFGREADVSKILALLPDPRHQQSQHPISGISIVGMAGVGKTTIAKSIYMKAKEEKRYDLVAWVCVSEDFNVQRIFGEMLRHFDRTVAPTNNINALLEDLAKELEKKTFLLILDDVWNEDPKKWDSFSSCLLKILKKNGSSIVATTRSEKVASVMELIPMKRYKMSGLSDNECWLIIKEKFLRSSGETSMPPNLEVIGHDVARKCGGLPLVASVMGGTLSRQADAGVWENIRDDNAWNFNSRDGNEIISILKISFDHLPSPLKKCFSYCSIFAKDFVIQKDDLVQLWMAVGFLEQSDEVKLSNESLMPLEDIGNDYFDHLLANSLFQDIERDIFGNIKSCKMHDVVHDLAVFVSKNETLVLKNGVVSQKSCPLHLRVSSSVEAHATFLKGVAPRLLSLFSNVDLRNMSQDLKNLKRIRSLSLKGADVDELPDTMGELKHLRYLDVSKTNIKALPKSFIKLYNLQTLKLIGCKNLQELPDEFKNLIRLKHFYFDEFHLMPREIRHLTSLQTLPLFVVGGEGYCIGELKPLSQLRGALKICNLRVVKSKLEASGANLRQKGDLYELKFEWTRNKEDCSRNEEDCWTHKEVLEGLQPHPNLRSLEIHGYAGETFPSWLERGVDLFDNPFGLEGGVDLSDSPFGLEGGVDLSDNPSGLEGGVDLSDYPSWLEGVVHLFDNPLWSEGDVNLSANSSWLERGVNLSDNSSLLNNLLELKFYNCGKCTNIPSCLGLLPSLQVLIIDGMKQVKCMGSKCDFNRSNTVSSNQGQGELITFFPTLKELYVNYMDNLEEWAEREGMLVFPCLETLQIYHCPRLESWSMGGFSSHHKLSYLSIRSCQNLKAIPNLNGLLSLRKLSIVDCEELICRPSRWGTCISVQSLYSRDCSNSFSMVEDIGGLHSITDLVVCNCKKLESFPKECPRHLSHLKMLEMGPFNLELEEFPGLTSIHHLHASLETLKLCGWDKLKSLPDQLQHLTTLKELELWNFNGLEALPEELGKLSSLTTLKIKKCNKLKEIPKDIGELRSLFVLEILICNELRSFPAECLGCLTHLKELRVGPFWSDLEEFPGFTSVNPCLHTSLEFLEINGWYKLKSLPDQLQDLTTITELRLLSFGSLEALPEWFSKLSSLQNLHIQDFPNLMHLPSSVEAMSCLSNLQSPVFHDCPKLRERCTKGNTLNGPRLPTSPPPTSGDISMQGRNPNTWRSIISKMWKSRRKIL